jgi:1A family penicillin-binding protein
MRRLWQRRGVRVVGALIALIAIGFVDMVVGTPNARAIRDLARMPEATKVFDVNGQLAFTIFQERRLAVPLSSVSPDLIRAVLAIEDQRFYRHRGVDAWRIGGALLANLRGSHGIQGGSTITQQLARKSFLTDERTLRRKLKEAFLAARIEEQFTKDEILEMYLNKVYLGNGYYGVEAAARGYFSKTAATLDTAEAALIAGLIQAPSLYEPTDHLDRAVARRSVVLREMARAGVLDPARETTLEHAPVKLKDGFERERSGQYFKNHLTRELAEKFGWDRLSKGGLKVYATIDMRTQAAAEQAMTRGLSAIEKGGAFRHPKRGDPRTLRAGQAPDYLQGALVSLDPKNGEVRAMVGGRDFDESQFNRAVQSRRQAGSAFKPFVYAAAIESGYTPATLVTDLDSPMMAADGAWLPDEGHENVSEMTIRAALRTSSNRAAVQVLRAVGIPRAVTYAQRLGLAAPAVPSLVLGTGDVTVLSMASAYGVFANGGLLFPPVFMRRVEDADGRVLYESRTQGAHALSAETAFLMAQMLRDVVDGGTGFRAREAGFRFAAAGKTGTTNDYHDAWFIGFTPALVTSVWIGFDQPKTIMAGGYAGQLAAPIWGRFMRDAAGQKDSGWITRPSGITAVEICTLSGQLASEGCRRAVVLDADGNATGRSVVSYEYFRRGTEPTDECPIHGHPIGGSDRWRSIISAPPLRATVRGGT